jgi:hypothetical protein
MLVLLFIAGIYTFIPQNLDLSAIAYSHCTASGAYRIVSDQTQWRSWQPDNSTGDSFSIIKKMYNSLDIHIHSGNTSVNSTLHLLPLSADSLALQWQCRLPDGDNPFTRLAQYRKAVTMKKNMSAVLAQLASFLSDTKNVYGYSIQRTSTIDTFLVATKSVFPGRPATPDIYRLVETLKKYTAGQGAKQTGPPIMNVTQQDDHGFQLMVALPTDRPLAGNHDIFFRKMIPGAFMVADVTGGDHSVLHALQQMHFYFDDYKKTSMAIPFAALITNRMQEPDTARWVTRIYAPVY